MKCSSASSKKASCRLTISPVSTRPSCRKSAARRQPNGYGTNHGALGGQCPPNQRNIARDDVLTNLQVKPNWWAKPNLPKKRQAVTINGAIFRGSGGPCGPQGASLAKREDSRLH